MCRHPIAFHTGPCRRGGRYWRHSKPPEKKEGDEEEEIQGKRRDEEENQDSLVVEVGMMVPLPLVSFPCSSCFKVIFSKKNLTNHIVEMNKDLTLCII